MTDFLQRAAEWISDYRDEHASQDVVIRWPDNPVGLPVKATVAHSFPESNPMGVRVHSQYTLFVTKYQILVDFRVPLDRGLLVEWNNQEFELAYDKRALWEWNDPHHVDIILKTIFKRDLDRGPT